VHDSGERRFFPELKLVGQRLDDAIPALRRFLDDARLHGIDEVAIVHGSGEGILRHAVHEQLAREQGVKSFFCADAAHGGTGVTIARFVG
jgi:DNA mismatch repair protein MutS2